MKAQWMERLAGLNEKLDAAKEAAKAGGRNGVVVEDGRYMAKIQAATIGEPTQSKRLQIAWEYLITEGEYTGTVVRDYEGLETEQNLTFVLRKLDTLGYDLDGFELNDLDEICAEITANQPAVIIRVRTKGEYQNVYVQQLIEDPFEEDAAPEPEPESEPEPEPEKPASKPKRTAKPKPKPEPEPEPEPEEEDDDEDLAVNTKVAFNDAKTGRLVTGTILGTTPEDTDIYRVKRDDTGKIAKKASADLRVLDADVDEEEEEDEDE